MSAQSSYSRCPLVVSSCDAYSDVWPVFFEFLDKYWPEVKGDVYLLSNQKAYKAAGIHSICTGKDFVVFDVPQGRIGLAICYDLWFPEVARTLVSMGAEIIIYPTLAGTIDRSAELILAQSTSIVNQCYTLSVNAAGQLGNGQSIVVGPEGNIAKQNS